MIRDEQYCALVLDADPAPYPGFYEALKKQFPTVTFSSLEELLASRAHYPQRILLLDVQTLQNAPTAQVAGLAELRGREPIALLSDRHLDEFLLDLRRWGFLQVCIKCDPVDPDEMRVFLESVVDPASGFGLHRYLSHRICMHNLQLTNIPEKNQGVERVINHFATADYAIHDLYDVRLILEETLNNAFFHSFRTATGEKKYHINTFQQLAPEERIRVEFGSNDRVAGFSVTDNAGALRIPIVLNKLERQLNKEGLFDMSGRGLYLSRMLTTSFIINLEPEKRTQVIALFDERRKLDRPKPFVINYVGTDDFADWSMEPDLD